MLYFLDDIIQEIIGRQLPNLFFSKEISDQESHSQIAVRLYFKGLSHGCKALTNTVSSPNKLKREHLLKERGANI